MKPILISLVLLLGCSTPVFAQSSPPSPVRAVPPKFPPEMRRAGTSGIVTLNFLVTEKGDVQEPTVQKATDDAFVPNALEAIKKWKFKPALKDGTPVAVRVTIPIKFDVDSDTE